MKTKKPTGRRIVVNNVTYYWKGSNVVVIRTEDNKVFGRVTAETLLNCTPDDWERGQRKRYLGITPGIVADWIKKQ